MKTIEKDILTVEQGIIVHQVNCQKAMNSGIAKVIREKWPNVFKEYIEYSDNNYYNGGTTQSLLGEVQIIPVEKDLYVCNLFGQLNYGYDGKRYTSYSAWEKALPEFKSFRAAKGLATAPVYFPYLIGCDRGGGDFRIISAMIEEYFPEAIFCKLSKEKI